MTVSLTEQTHVSPNYPQGLLPGTTASGEKVEFAEVEVAPLSAEQKRRVIEMAAHLGDSELVSVPRAAAHIGEEAVAFVQHPPEGGQH